MKKLLLILFLFTLNCQAQRTLPYPIILVHGFNGSSSAWDDWKFLIRTKTLLTVDPNDLSFDLNADQNPLASIKEKDVRQYKAASGNYDIYTINFEQNYGLLTNQSNQSGAVKQGYALGIAIKQVLAITGADKVILFGHSMGGLAAREYIQTPSNWPGDGKHHVAKLVTLGTPHGGSDLGSGDLNLGFIAGFDEASEAVRDLRTRYSSAFKIGAPGVYLYGGFESAVTRGLISSYYNKDINSNGYEGELIQGLNQKSISTDISYAAIIASGLTGILGVDGNSDGVVSVYSQNINNHCYQIKADLFYHSCIYDTKLTCHINEPKKAIYQSVNALDEPSTFDLAYEVKLNQPFNYKGFMTTRSDGNTYDDDLYKIRVNERGNLTINASFEAESYGGITLYDANGKELGSKYSGGNTTLSFNALLTSGIYYVNFSGETAESWRNYDFNMGFCAVPAFTHIDVRGPSTFCEGNTLLLVAPNGYDGYTWYKNGTLLAYNTSAIEVKQSGTYNLQVIKCGFPIQAASPVVVTVNPYPAKPTISLTSQGLMSSSLTGNQWLNNSAPVNGATNQTFSEIQSGTYSVLVTVAGCSSPSDPYIVTATEESPIDLVTVYPNPNKGVFQIKTPVKGETTIDVINLLGQPVYSESFQSIGTFKSVSLDSRWKGRYILRLKTANGLDSYKLLIE